jgi:DNA transformation protein and related proteins
VDPEHIRELFAAFGAVDVRRMFGGAGVFANGVMIALVTGGVVYLKTDAETVASFEREGLVPFSYATKDGTRTITSYWRMPDRLYDDAEELAQWARAALAAARRKAKAQSVRRRSSPSVGKPARRG